MKKNIKKQRVFAMMSGGVDSSVAALLLKKRGYDVVGVFMRCYNLDGCAERDAEDARRVAEKLKIPFYVWDFEEEYKKKVVDYMVDGYRRGITPNPDVMCNKEIKFGLFLKKALEMGADYVATGHYVRLRREFSIFNSQFSNESKIKKIENLNIKNLLKIRNYKLKIAKDVNKDQSYFLWTLTQEQLKHCLFPVGDYLKSEIREIARKAGLPTAEKKDSQGICFLGKVTLDAFLENYLPKKPGRVILINDETLRPGLGQALRPDSWQEVGQHKGAHFYTIGQRHIGLAHRGLMRTRCGTTQTKDVRPVYVAEKNVKSNTLIVAEGSDNPALYKKEIGLTDVNFINTEHSHILKNVRMLNVLMRVRYRQPLAKATLIYADSPAKISFGNFGGRAQINADKNPRQSASNKNKPTRVRVIFEQAQKFVAPGQSAVFYEHKKNSSAMSSTDLSRKSSGLKMLGGGIIV